MSIIPAIICSLVSISVNISLNNLILYIKYYEIYQVRRDFKMGLSFRKKSAKNYIQFATRFEEDIMLQLRKLNQKTGLSINEIINRCIRYALDNSYREGETGKNK